MSGESDQLKIDWLKKHAIPIATTEPDDGFDDLMPLKELIGDARIVGLGEATHGTHEFFTMKHRLVEFLVREMAFTVFALEANTPEAFLMDDYIRNGTGSPEDLLRGMHFWTWNTQEILNMIRWMRAYNESKPAAKPIRFTGFDAQFVALSINIVLEFVKHANPEYYETATGMYSDIGNALPNRINFNSTNDDSNNTIDYADINRMQCNAERLTKHLEKNQVTYSEKCSLKEIAWAIHNARIVSQFLCLMTEARTGVAEESRDLLMAKNINWIQSQNRDAKIIVWAHNYHIARGENNMGYNLHQKYGDTYLPIGFCFHEGLYNAREGFEGDIRAFKAAPAHEGSCERLLHNAGIPNFILDLRNASADDPSSEWLTKTMDMHDIGAVKQKDEFRSLNISEEFDALVFIDSTTPSILLPQG